MANTPEREPSEISAARAAVRFRLDHSTSQRRRVETMLRSIAVMLRSITAMLRATTGIRRTATGQWYQYPRSDSNRHWDPFKGSASAVGLRGPMGSILPAAGNGTWQ